MLIKVNGLIAQSESAKKIGWTLINTNRDDDSPPAEHAIYKGEQPKTFIISYDYGEINGSATSRPPSITVNILYSNKDSASINVVYGHFVTVNGVGIKLSTRHGKSRTTGFWELIDR